MRSADAEFPASVGREGGASHTPAILRQIAERFRRSAETQPTAEPALAALVAIASDAASFKHLLEQIRTVRQALATDVLDAFAADTGEFKAAGRREAER